MGYALNFLGLVVVGLRQVWHSAKGLPFVISLSLFEGFPQVQLQSHDAFAASRDCDDFVVLKFSRLQSQMTSPIVMITPESITNPDMENIDTKK